MDFGFTLMSSISLTHAKEPVNLNCPLSPLTSQKKKNQEKSNNETGQVNCIQGDSTYNRNWKHNKITNYSRVSIWTANFVTRKLLKNRHLNYRYLPFNLLEEFLSSIDIHTIVQNLVFWTWPKSKSFKQIAS